MSLMEYCDIREGRLVLAIVFFGVTSPTWAAPAPLPQFKDYSYSMEELRVDRKYVPYWQEKTLRIHLASDTPPVIVVRPGFATDIEVNFPYRGILLGDYSWSVHTVRGLFIKNKNLRHFIVHAPQKREEHSVTNILIFVCPHP